MYVYNPGSQESVFLSTQFLSVVSDVVRPQAEMQLTTSTPVPDAGRSHWEPYNCDKPWKLNVEARTEESIVISRPSHD